MTTDAAGHPSPAVTVVIPARNAASTLADQLTALERQRHAPPFRVLVVDNGSTDDTSEVARSFKASSFDLVVVAEGAPGVNQARNRGIGAAPDGLVLLCDADDIVSDGWVRAMADAFEEGCWLAGVVDYTVLNSPRTRSQWGVPERSDCRVEEPYVDRTFGGNCGLSRQMWEDLGGFDARLSGSGDETEFFTRAHLAGYRQRWVPTAVIGYRLRPGLRAMCRQRYRQGVNQVRMQQVSSATTHVAGERATVLAIGKLLAASPKYALTSEARVAWLASMSRHLGRLAGHRKQAS